MLMIRLARFGGKKKPTYRVVVIDKERARDSRSVEVVGTYSPVAKPTAVKSEPRPHRALDEERRAAVGYGGPPAARSNPAPRTPLNVHRVRYTCYNRPQQEGENG